MSRGQGRVFRYADSKNWWLDYSIGGTRHREPAKTANRTEALRLLRDRIGAREAGTLVGRPDKVTLEDLRTLGERQYELDGRQSIDRLKGAWDNLEALFPKETIATTLTIARLDVYAAHRLKAVTRSTLNYELAVLRRGFRLAIDKGLLATAPRIKLPRVHNARQGFCEEGGFAALVLELPADVRALVTFLRLTGWRRDDARTLTWAAVDWHDQGLEGAKEPVPGPNACLRLAAADTKGHDARLFPIGAAPELQALLLERWRARAGVFVFHRKGEALGKGAIRAAWTRARTRAGLDGLLLHDLRRTAARELRRAGVSEGEIMRLCGWKTRAMFDRYNVIDERDLAAAVAKRFNGRERAESTAPEPAPGSLSSSAT